MDPRNGQSKCTVGVPFLRVPFSSWINGKPDTQRAVWGFTLGDTPMGTFESPLNLGLLLGFLTEPYM